MFTGKSDAQTTTIVPQCCVCLFLRESTVVRGNAETIQHKSEDTELSIPICIRAVAYRTLGLHIK